MLKPILTIFLLTMFISGCNETKSNNVPHSFCPETTSQQRTDCEKAGGTIKNVGRAQCKQCIYSYSDAGKSCTGSNQCEGRCLTEDRAEAGGFATGICEADSNAFGCSQEIDDNGVALGTLCVD
ncbi:hypothetical protein [Candidatus Albibeggiatoa sp. nov. NOAA]|uniref:hypothetical protein n=1 Tax=Candidatus Albibeggiatoa sp. nov. NOAA TaxID=3162724 RepID=UPI0032F982FF|nr:hypothetical protein [Thiotrichaceae bacterium]